jgi:hypothetical protein
MLGMNQGASGMGGNAGDLDGQNFGLGLASKDQRANKEALQKLTRNKRQTGAAGPTTKPPGAQHTK